MNAHVSIQAPFTLPASPAQKLDSVRAEFLSSTEPTCRAHFDYAREDARDIAALAVSLRSFLTGAVAKLRQLNYGRASGADLALMGECIAEQLTEVMTPEAARLFDAEWRSICGEI